MSLETIYMIGQTVAAIAILLSLIYAGLQVRQNSQLKRAELTTQSGIALHEFHARLGETKEIAAMWRKGLLGDVPLDETERTQFTLWITAAFLGYENIYLTYRSALLDPQLQDRSYRQMVFLFQYPGVVDWWRRHKLNLTTDFIAYVEAEVLPTSTLLSESKGMGGQAAPHKAPGLTPSND